MKTATTDKKLHRIVNTWLDSWAPFCGAPRSVFEGQFRAVLNNIFNEIDARAERDVLESNHLSGEHYLARGNAATVVALKEVRKELL